MRNRGFWLLVLLWLAFGAAAQQAEVLDTGASLRLRAEPNTAAAILALLPPRTPLTLLSRSAGNTWYEVETADGQRGWVKAEFVRVSSLEEVATQTIALPLDPAPFVSGITSRVRSIYSYGQTLGNRDRVFSKIGDSITFAPFNLRMVGEGSYTLSEYAYLQPMIAHFSSVFARTHNAFANESLAAQVGWSSTALLRASFADKALCLPDETPLACEYRLVKPAFALIMIGTNDAGFLDEATYRNNLRAIVQRSVDTGVVPILSTLPARRDQEAAQAQALRFNTIIRQTARALRVPLIDLYAALETLPDAGLSPDGVHLSLPPRGYADCAVFTAENLSYGYTVRNLLQLHALDAVWRAAAQRGG